MNSGWKECKLGDVAEIIPGFAFKSEHFGDKGMPVIKITDINPPYINIEDAQKVNLDSYNLDKLEKYFVSKDDFVVAMTGATIGKVGKNIICTQAILNQRVAKIKPFAAVENNFVYFSLLLDNFQEFIQNNIDSHSAQENISGTSIARFTLLLPPRSEQRAIAGVLSSLDDKIDLLYRQNKTLEGMAETLWRKMFIEDADPNWKKGKLGDYLKVQGGYAFKSADFKDVGQIGIIKITNISSGLVDIVNTQFVSREIIQTLDNKFKITTGSILIAMTGAEIGKIGIVEKTEKEIWLNQRVGMFHELKRYGNLLGFFALNSDEGQEHILSSATGSAQPNISAAGIEDFEMPIVPDEMLNHFGISTQSLFDKICFNLSQIHTLSRARDTLLPKLMSGDVRVKM